MEKFSNRIHENIDAIIDYISHPEIELIFSPDVIEENIDNVFVRAGEDFRGLHIENCYALWNRLCTACKRKVIDMFYSFAWEPNDRVTHEKMETLLKDILRNHQNICKGGHDGTTLFTSRQSNIGEDATD